MFSSLRRPVGTAGFRRNRASLQHQKHRLPLHYPRAVAFFRAMKTLRVKTNRRTQFVDITREVEQVVRESDVQSGICHVYVPHTTAGIAINEHADPDVAGDLEAFFDRLVPHQGPYRHAEGNTDSHVKALLTGTSQIVFIDNG